MDPTHHLRDGVMPHGSGPALRRPITSAIQRWSRLGPPSPRRLQELGRELTDLGATDAELTVVASELMWHHRSYRLPGPVELRDAADDGASGRFVYYCVLRHAGYLFDLASCRELATEARARWPDDPWFEAMLGLAELAAGHPTGAQHLEDVLASCTNARIRHLALTAYVISPAEGAAARALDLVDRMRRDGQGDVVVDYREAVARRRLGDLSGALDAIGRALHELATGTYDEPTRGFVSEQLRQERERILDRIDRSAIEPFTPRPEPRSAQRSGVPRPRRR